LDSVELVTVDVPGDCDFVVKGIVSVRGKVDEAISSGSTDTMGGMKILVLVDGGAVVMVTGNAFNAI
jgi:hypothetical protein